jgi:hypothetical protein
MGYEEREWLELGERAVYVPDGQNTYFRKKCECRSYISGKLYWTGIPSLLTGKGTSRWKTVRKYITLTLPLSEHLSSATNRSDKGTTFR